MTEDLTTLARKAMALPGAPDVDPIPHFPWRRVPADAGPNPDAMEWVWNLSDTTSAGWALGGVLLGALGEERVCVDFSCPDDFRLRTGITYWKCPTLAEACCRVAVSLGRWPGGVE